MSDTAQIRKKNLFHVRQMLAGGEEYTKQGIALATGLSVATCNTLLNLLVKQGEILGEKRQLGSVGRASVVYRINKEYKSILCVQWLREEEKISVTSLYLYGGQRSYDEYEMQVFSLEVLTSTIESSLSKYENITQILVGIPDDSEIKKIQKKLSESFTLPVFVQTESEYIAMGIKMLCSTEDKLVLYCHLSADGLPKAMLCKDGKLIVGSRAYPQIVLPDQESEQDYFRAFQENGSKTVCKIFAPLIAVLRPDFVIVTGEGSARVNKGECEETCRALLKQSPSFIVNSGSVGYYIIGMGNRARFSEE